MLEPEGFIDVEAVNKTDSGYKEDSLTRFDTIEEPRKKKKKSKPRNTKTPNGPKKPE